MILPRITNTSDEIIAGVIAKETWALTVLWYLIHWFRIPFPVQHKSDAIRSAIDDARIDCYLVMIDKINTENIDNVFSYAKTMWSRRMRSLTMKHSLKDHAEIDDLSADTKTDTETDYFRMEYLAIIQHYMSDLNFRHREILERYYLQHETKEEIIGAMRLTLTGYRLMKSRALSQLRLLIATRYRSGVPDYLWIKALECDKLEPASSNLKSSGQGN